MRYYAAAPRTRSAATSRQRAVNWGWIYVLGPLLVGLLLFVHKQSSSGMGHMLLQCAIVLLVYGLLPLWLQSGSATVDTPKPVEKPKVVYVVYPPIIADKGCEAISSLTDGMLSRAPQSISLAALPQRDGVSLQERRN